MACRIVRLVVPIVGLVVLLAGGCASTPNSAFYGLSVGASPQVAQRPELALGIGPVDLPRYLERPQIVSRGEGNRLTVDEFNRWGGSLEEEISRVLVGRLGRGLRSERVYGYPSRVVSDTDYRVALDIRRFDGALAGEVVLDVAWSLIADRSGEVIETRQSVFVAQAAGPGYDPYVSAMNALVMRLADELLERLARL